MDAFFLASLSADSQARAGLVEIAMIKFGMPVSPLRLGPWPSPEIPELDDNILATSLFYLLLRINLGHPPQIAGTPEGRNLAVNMVRLTDKAVLEYELGRQHAIAWTESIAHEERQLEHYFRAVDRFENCIGALHRTLLHVESVRQLRDAPDVRQLWRALRNTQKRINDMRDEIEHAEEAVKAGRLVEHSYQYLDVDTVRIADQAITFTDIGRAILRTYEIVRELFGRSTRRARRSCRSVSTATAIHGDRRSTQRRH